jgi:Inner membrane protein YgaP-like, transmembrane domain
MEGQMNKNVGTIDRVVRVIVGLLLLAYAIPIGFPNTGWNWVGWIGIVPIFTAVIGYCPAYTVFGFSSCESRAHQH